MPYISRHHAAHGAHALSAPCTTMCKLTRGKPMVETTASTLTASRFRVGEMRPICRRGGRVGGVVHKGDVQAKRSIWRGTFLNLGSSWIIKSGGKGARREGRVTRKKAKPPTWPFLSASCSLMLVSRSRTWRVGAEE